MLSRQLKQQRLLVFMAGLNCLLHDKDILIIIKIAVYRYRRELFLYGHTIQDTLYKKNIIIFTHLNHIFIISALKSELSSGGSHSYTARQANISQDSPSTPETKALSMTLTGQFLNPDHPFLVSATYWIIGPRAKGPWMT